jgi:phospholipase/carboxylesterase
VTDPGETVPDAYAGPLSAVGSAALGALEVLEVAQRRLHPPAIETLRAWLRPQHARLEDALARFRDTPVPAGLAALHGRLGDAAGACAVALRLFVEPAAPEVRVARILHSLREHCRAQALLYPLRRVLPPLARFFVEPAFHDRLEALDPEPPAGLKVGLHRAGPEDDPDGRGGFSLYVPERYDGSAERPLVVALHGGYGCGRDFLWTWLREARGREFLLLAPTSRGTTWALDAPAVEARRLGSMVETVCGRWRVDRARILLTGLSDGATFALLAGLAAESPFTALAPVAGVLHPANFRNGNLERVAGRRIHQVHGALDWLFPVTMARQARDVLREAGAELDYREIDDLSHAYPREANDRILTWFDPTLALPSDRV